MAVTHYFWDELSDNILAEYDGEGNLLTQYTHEPTYHGPLISQCDRNGCTTYYHFDGQGSTRRLSDENEFLSEPLNYTAFGELLTPAPHLPPFLYIGELGYYFDHELGYTYVRARTYAAWLGRWLSPDPAGFVDGVNLLEYSANNPVSKFDPSGKGWLGICGGCGCTPLTPPAALCTAWAASVKLTLPTPCIGKCNAGGAGGWQAFACRCKQCKGIGIYQCGPAGVWVLFASVDDCP